MYAYDNPFSTAEAQKTLRDVRRKPSKRVALPAEIVLELFQLYIERARDAGAKSVALPVNGWLYRLAEETRVAREGARAPKR